MAAMFPGFPKVGINPTLAGSKNQAAMFLIAKVAETNKLNPLGLTTPVVGLMRKSQDVVPVNVTGALVPVNPTYNRQGRIGLSLAVKTKSSGSRISLMI